MTAAHLSSAAAVVAALTANAPAQSDDGPRAKSSLCLPAEPVLFSCKIGTKTVSICGHEDPVQTGAIYRYGRPGHVERQATDLRRAFSGWPGGGETQVYADTSTHRYVVYDRMVRIGSDPEGHIFSRTTQGLLVQSGGKTIASRRCVQPRGDYPAFDQQRLETLLPRGEFIGH